MPRLRTAPDPGYGNVPLILVARWFFLSISLACFALSGWLWLDQRIHQAEAGQLFSAAPPGALSPTPPALPAPAPPAGPVARLEIARLGVEGFVEVGLDAGTLRRAIGLSPHGARPGEPGNVVLAAHRDTFFSGLRGARAGDLIKLQTPGGRTFYYRISRMFLVNPVDSWVMHSSPDRNILTLITCYPFRYIGKAPRRFVVQAQPAEESASQEGRIAAVI